MRDLELFSIKRNTKTPLRIELEQILEDIEPDFKATNRLEHAISHIRNTSQISNLSLLSSDLKGCLEALRELIVRLKMLEWGLGGGTAGLFLVFHHSILGSYFGDVDGNNWPHIPLHKEPTLLEEDFNNLLTNIIYQLSNGILNNVSLLDLPAFGSTIGTLKKGLRKQFVWPTKINFASIKLNPAENKTKISASYKTLTEDWANYMDQLDKKDHMKYFTSQMRNNKYLNFTQMIKADMKTFLITVAGNNTTG